MKDTNSAKSPCSLCGSRAFRDGCQRCVLRRDAEISFEAAEELREEETLQGVYKNAAIALESLQRGRGTITVALVGCSKQKANHAGGLPASDLYAGRLAQAGLAYARSMGWDVHFLSALHGILPPHARIAPYDLCIQRLLPSERKEWGNRVVGELLASYPLQPLDIIFLAGNAYVEPVLEAIPSQVAYWTYDEPLKGMDLFERLRWFKAQELNVAVSK